MQKIFTLLVIGILSLNGFVQAQNYAHKEDKTQFNPSSLIEGKDFTKLQKHILAAPDVETLLSEDVLRDKNGMFYRIGVTTPVNFYPQTSGTWETLENGDRLWKLRISSVDAQALTVFFDEFEMFGNSFVQVFNTQGKALSYRYDASENLDHGMQNIPLNLGDDIVVVLYQAKKDKTPRLHIDEIGYAYRGMEKDSEKSAGDSESCEINVNCTLGNNYQDEKRGVARILVVDSGFQGWCSGSLVNNTNQDCKPYFLTALHCGVTSSTSNFNQWKFYFNFELSGCSGTPSENIANSNNTITGCVKKASSNDGGGNTGSDYLLVQLGSASNETATINKLKSSSINAYWNGWDANNTSTNNGVSIHHPAGDVKKISSFTSSLQTASWNSSGKNAHWYLTWSQGVTEGGSSGSPLFVYNGGNSRIIGTLTGGSSYCSAPNNPDLYGKMSYHWDQNTSSGSQKLKDFLAPGSNAKTIDGSYDPCDGSGSTNPPGGTPCMTETTEECDEYISNITLNTLNNSSMCDGHRSFSNTTSLVRGQTYTVYLETSVLSNPSINGFYNDNLIVWIDWNNDNTFSNNERVYYEVFQEGVSTPMYATFTVPLNAYLGQVYMRAKIGFNSNTPCGTFTWGDVEDYKITILPVGSTSINQEFLNELSIYPNPTNNVLNFRSSNEGDQEYSIEVYDLTGKVVVSGETRDLNQYSLDVSTLAKGMYQVGIRIDGNQRLMKFIKQ